MSETTPPIPCSTVPAATQLELRTELSTWDLTSPGCLHQRLPSSFVGTGQKQHSLNYTMHGAVRCPGRLGTPVVPFVPFYMGVSLVKLNTRKKGILIIKGLLGNLENKI